MENTNVNVNVSSVTPEYYNNYIKADNNKIINEESIKWIKKIDDCLEICTSSKGCRLGINTHSLCKVNNYDSYMKLNAHFNEYPVATYTSMPINK